MCIWQSSCWYSALMSLGMTLIRANTLAFGLIGKDRPHRIIKICFGNLNLVFGSEVALLGFWEYMFGILVTVQAILTATVCNYIIADQTLSLYILMRWSFSVDQFRNYAWLRGNSQHSTAQDYTTQPFILTQTP